MAGVEVLDIAVAQILIDPTVRIEPPVGAAGVEDARRPAILISTTTRAMRWRVPANSETASPPTGSLSAMRYGTRRSEPSSGKR